MSLSIVLRPIPNDERPWVERHIWSLIWGSYLIYVGACILSPDFMAKWRTWNKYDFLWFTLKFNVFFILVYWSDYARPSRLATRQSQQLIVTDRDITLKGRPSEFAPEEVIWCLRRHEIGAFRLVARGPHSDFVLERPTESNFRSFIRWLGMRDGPSLRAFGWVNDARPDPQNRPERLSDLALNFRKKKRYAQMLASDLGQALMAAGYGSVEIKT